jgi:hypothetical protein
MKKRDLRKRKIKLRKNFFPTLLVIFLFWGLSAFIVYFIDPSMFGILPVFFLTVFIAILFTASTLFANTRRGLLASFLLTFFLILRYLGVGNIINLLLILGLGISIDVYLSKR